MLSDALTASWPHGRQESRDAILRAVELLRAEHFVRETSAFRMLVQASIDSGASVRDTAERIVQKSQTSQ